MPAEFPSCWQLRPLEDCMEAIIDYRGKTPRKTAYGIPLITARVVRNGRIETPDEFIDPEEYIDWMRRGLPMVGDVLLTTEAPLGEVAQVKAGKIALAQRLIALRGRRGEVDNTFLKFLMQSDFVQDQLRARSTGTTVVGIKQSELRQVLLPIPELAEQQAIACILGALDDKIELNWHMNRTLEAIARATFKNWFVGFGPVRAKADGGQPPGLARHIAELFPDSFEESELGKIPKGWEIGSILKIADLLSGGTPKTSVQEYWNGDIPWASAKDVSQCGEPFLVETERRISEAGLTNSSTKIIPTFSTVVVARGATTGRMAMFGSDIAMNQTCYAITSKDGLPFFLYCHFGYFVKALVFSAHGSVFDTITTRTFQTIDTIIPGEKVRKSFDRLVKPLFLKILGNQNESRKLSDLRDTLLPKLISGELRVADAERIVARCV